MQINFPGMTYRQNISNRNFGANAPCFFSKKMARLLTNAPRNEQFKVIRALGIIKNTFTECFIIKEKDYTVIPELRHYFLLTPKFKKIPLISINHRWNRRDIIDIANKMLALTVKYPEHNPYVYKWLKIKR